MNPKTPGMVMLGGAALIIVGSFLPWAQVRSLFGTISTNGMDGDGILTLAGGVIIAVLGFTSIEKTNRGEPQSLLWFVSFPFAVAVAVVALYDLVSVSQIIADQEAATLAATTYGPGLFLIIAGAGIAGLGALRIPRKPQEPEWTPTELPTNIGVRDDTQITGLERLRDLHDSGAIMDEEYQLAKSRLLAGGS